MPRAQRHMLCLGSDWQDGQTFHSTGVAQGFLLIPVSGADEAEGRVREQVGEEKKSEGTDEMGHPRET